MTGEFAWLDEEPKTETELALVPRVLSSVEIPADVQKRNRLVQRAWDSLTPRQQYFLDAFRRNGFSERGTVRALAGTMHSVALTTVKNWKHNSKDYAFILKVISAIQRDDIIDRDRLLVRADEIAEQALEPKPILYKGRPTGFYENQLDTALRANEQLMKTQKMLGGEQEGSVQQGPALIIQVIQPQNGNIIDVTPGVKVALPEPVADEP